MTTTDYATLRRLGCSHAEILYLDKEPGPWYSEQGKELEEDN